MARGGRRQGAGRPKGTGSPLSALKRLRAAERSNSLSYLRELAGTENDPAVIALTIAKDVKTDVRLRLDCCLGLMPFVHPRLSHAIVDATTTTMTFDPVSLLAELDARLERASAKSDGKTIEHADLEKAA